MILLPRYLMMIVSLAMISSADAMAINTSISLELQWHKTVKPGKVRMHISQMPMVTTQLINQQQDYQMALQVLTKMTKITKISVVD